MSYFNFYTKNIISKVKTCVHQNDPDGIIIGTCMTMCPKDEIRKREKEKLVHMLEVVESERKLVKEHSRSAADSVKAVPHLLRPFPVLKETVQYLLMTVTKREDVPVNVIYDFINNRLRCVRQDMTIQRLPAHQCIILLEPMVRFYVYSGYKLCNYSTDKFDQVLNKKSILACLKCLLMYYDSLPETNNEMAFEELLVSMSELNTNEQNTLTCDRVLMESLYILCNIDDVNPLCRYLNLPENIKSSRKVQLAYRISRANLCGNYVKVTKYMKLLCPLTFCALSVYMPTLQRNALHIISQSYSGQYVLPTQIIAKWLLFNDEQEAREACVYYGLDVVFMAPLAYGIRFSKTSFRNGEAILPPKNLHKFEKKLNLDLDNILTYKSKKNVH